MPHPEEPNLKNIAAFTETTTPAFSLPGYISINEEGDKTFATIRTRSTGEQARVEVTKAHLVTIAKAILNYYEEPELGI